MANSFRVRFEVDGDGKVQAQLAGIGTSATPATKAVKALGDEVLKVGDSLNKTNSRQNDYQRQLTVLDAALKKNIITQREYNDLTRKAWQQSPDGEKWLQFGQTVGTALLGIGGAAAAGFALVIKNSMDAEQELAQLDAVLKSTGQSATWSRDQIADMADGIAKASTYSGGEVTNAATRLLSYSGIVSGNFKDALQVAIDQSVRLGISVEQSAETIGRALEKPSKAAAALAQQGFGAAFTPAVRKSIQALEDAGKAAEAQRIILDILNESYEGAAKASRDTFGGALKALMNTLDDLTTGDSGSLDGATHAVNSLTETLGSDQTRKAFADITALVAGLAGEMANGISLAINYISRMRELSALDGASQGALTSASESALNEQLGAVASKKRLVLAVEPQSDARDKQVADLERQQQALQREITRRNVADNFRGVTGSVDSSAKPALTGDVAEPKVDKAAQRQADRIKKATDTLAAAQRDWTTELGSVDNPIIDEYTKRLDDIAEKSEAATRAGVPKDQIDSFTASMRELATQIRDKELSTFQKEFSDDTAEMAAQLAGPGVAALLKYNQAMADNQKLLDSGVIKLDQYAAREQALRDQMNAGAIQMLQDISEERQTLALNSEQLEIYNRLKQAGVDANSAYGQSITQMTQQLQRERETVAVINDVQSATRDLAIESVANFGQAGDAVADYVERVKKIAASMLVDKGLQYLFGLFGTAVSSYTGSGLGAGSTSGFGNNLDTFTGNSLYGFGGGRATGGTVTQDKVYEVTEGGRPELLRQGNKTWLLPGSDGVVVPASAAAASGGGASSGSIVNNIKVVGGSGTPTVNSSRNATGGLDLEVIVDQVENRIAGNFSTRSGALYTATKGTLAVEDRV